MKEPQILAVIALVVLVVVARAVRSRRRSGSDFWPVTARRLLTSPEQVLYRRLQAALPELTVLAQVAVSQLVEVRRVPGRQSVFNRISRLVADFVLCAPDFTVVAVIELDDRSHETPQRADADARKSASLEAAGIPVLRFNVRSMPSAQDLRAAVDARTHPGARAELETRREPTR